MVVMVNLQASFEDSLLELPLTVQDPYIWYDLDKFLRYQSTNLLPTFASLT